MELRLPCFAKVLPLFDNKKFCYNKSMLNRRESLASTLQSTDKAKRKEELHKAKATGQYWDERTSRHEANQPEVSINEGLGVYIKRKTLYHGSPNLGIQLFNPAEDYTIGKGVYFTSHSKDAISYAKVRTVGHGNIP